MKAGEFSKIYNKYQVRIRKQNIYMLPIISQGQKKIKNSKQRSRHKYNQGCKQFYQQHQHVKPVNRSVGNVSPSQIRHPNILPNANLGVLLNNSANQRYSTDQQLSKYKMRKLVKYGIGYGYDKQNIKSATRIRSNEVNPNNRINVTADKVDSRAQISLGSRVFSTKDKPPHRYKTTILAFKHCILLYGGLGCQKNLTWAKFSFQTMNWEIFKQTHGIKPINSYVPCSPIYGHTMVKYRDNAVVYGGSCNDEINEITIVNTIKMSLHQGSRCPYRRKQHAAVALNDLMVVHGGIQARQTKSQLFIYNFNADKWSVIPNFGLPALSNHKIAKGKNNKEAYIFGGLNSKGKSVNKLYKIKNIGAQITNYKYEQIQCLKAPNARHSFCFERLSNNFLVLYGGRQDNQITNELQNIQYGVYNDLFTYNMQRRVWNKIQNNFKLQYCYGMASCQKNGTVFVFGGSNYCRYANAAITLIWNADEKSDPFDSRQVSEHQLFSSRRISHQFINF